MLTTPPDQWYQRAAADRRNPRHAFRGAFYDFDSLLAIRGSFEHELGLATKTERFSACQAAITEVARRYAACPNNVAIILGNDQREIFGDQFTPAFLVYAADTIPNIYPDQTDISRLDELGLTIALPGHVGPGTTMYPGAPNVAERIVDELLDRDFDMSMSYELPRPNGRARGIPHAYGFIFRRIMHDKPPPTVPIFANVGEARNQPRLHRMIAFGHALKAAIDALPAELNVAIFASGGFTHFTLDEDFDRELLDAMLAGDEEKLLRYPESWFWGNTCEIKTWYMLVAAMNDTGCTMDVIDYVPCYRSEAGTGQGMIFASWI